MEEPVKPTLVERSDMQQLAAAIVESVRVNAKMPLPGLKAVAIQYTGVFFDAVEVEGFVFKLAQEIDQLAARLAEVERERDGAAEAALLPIRRALFTRGFCGDGGLTTMVVRALEESQERGRVENCDVLAALLEASDAFPPDMEGTVAARVRLLLARATAAEAAAARLRTGWDAHARRDQLAEALATAEQTIQNAKYGMEAMDSRPVVLARALLSLAAADPEFAECASCTTKSGSPTLCRSCLHNRTTINQLRAEREELIKVYVLAARLRTFPVPFEDHFQLVGAVDECRSVLEPPVDNYEPTPAPTSGERVT